MTRLLRQHEPGEVDLRSCRAVQAANVGDQGDDLVTLEVTMSVVELFELIGINHQQAQRHLLLKTVLPHFLQNNAESKIRIRAIELC